MQEVKNTSILKRKTTSIKVSPDLWRKVKIHCIENSIEISDWLESIIKKQLGNKK